MEHTQGEWKYVVTEKAVYIEAPQGHILAEMADRPNAAIDASIMAAAPDMYKALLLAPHFSLQIGESPERFMQYYYEWYHIIRRPAVMKPVKSREKIREEDQLLESL